MKKMMISCLCLAVVFMASAARAEEVWVTTKGNKYHLADCQLIKNKEHMRIERSAAKQKGLEPCARCFKPQAEKLSKEKKESKIKKVD